jgi:hypothetical protein
MPGLMIKTNNHLKQSAGKQKHPGNATAIRSGRKCFQQRYDHRPVGGLGAASRWNKEKS